MSKISNFDYRMFEMARKVAEESDFSTFHVGCVIVYKKHIIASASNSKKTNPMQKKYNRKYREFNKSNKPVVDSVHAEIAALNSIPYPVGQNINWREVKVYVYRVCKGKRLGAGMARCCPACLHAIKDKGIQHLYYSTDDGFAYERLF